MTPRAYVGRAAARDRSQVARVARMETASRGARGVSDILFQL